MTQITIKINCFSSLFKFIFFIAFMINSNALMAKKIDQEKATQWMIGANVSGTILPKHTWHAKAGRNYNIKNLERRRFLQYEKQGTARGINLGWTSDAKSSTAKNRAQWFFARKSNSQNSIVYGERVAIGWGERNKPFIQYAKRKVGINLDWSKTPVYEWVFLGGEVGKPVQLGKDRVVIFNMKHREPLIYFDRTVGANMGWPDSTRWNGPTDEIIDGLAWTANELAKELNRMVLICKGNPSCQAKIKSYQSYMIQLRTGVMHYKLPQKYQDMLVGFYPQLRSLKQFKFGYGTRQPKGNATTDCSRTYFNDRAYVDRLRQGRLEGTDFRWLLHEIQHYNQCRQVGGRSHYAKMWFADLQSSLLTGNVSNMKKIHDAMPMEKEASQASTKFCKLLKSCQ